MKIESVEFKMDPSDIVSVSFKERETGTPMAAPPDKFVEMDFVMHENKLRNGDFVKLDEPLKDILPKITLIAPEEKNKDGNPLEVTVGSEFSGEGNYSIGGSETHKFQYTFLNQHAVEGNKYIYAWFHIIGVEAVVSITLLPLIKRL